MTNPEGGKGNGFKGRGWVIRTRRWWVMLTTKGETRAGAPSLFSLYIRFQVQLFGKRLRCQAQTPAPPNSPNLGTTTTSISWQTSGQNTACPHLDAIQPHKGTNCHAQQRGQTLKLYAKWKESHTSGHIHHGFIYTWCSKYANYKQKIGGRLSGALGWKRGVHGERGRGALLGRGTCWTLTCGNSHATQHVYQRCLKCRLEAGELQSR